MNRTDRLYALVEQLRAISPHGRSARRLAQHFEVSTRTVERDIAALQQAGLAIYAVPGRTGGYVLDKSVSLPPLNFTPAEAVAVAVALTQSDRTPFSGDASSALQKILAAMPEAAAERARELAGSVRLLRRPTPVVHAGITAVVRQALAQRRVLLIEYGDRHGGCTVREVVPELLVAGPHGWYLTGWCRLRGAGRAFRLDRIAAARLTAERAVPRPRPDEPPVAGLVASTPVWA